MARFVAEISSNHNGDKQRCLAMIRAAAACGCWGVKFQLFRIEELFAPEVLRTSATHRDRRRWELPRYLLPDLAACARDEGLAFGCTPFDLAAVTILRPHVDFLKIASYELPWLELVKTCAATKLPLMVSCGMADAAEITAAVRTAREAGCTDLTVMHCVSNYPAAPESCNLAALGSLRSLLDKEFPTAHTGWSDHSVDPGVVRRAVAHWGAEVVEFHFDLEGAGEEFGGGHCWLPASIAPVIAGQEFTAHEGCDGIGELSPAFSEIEERAWRADPSDGLRPTLPVRQVWREREAAAPPKPVAVLVAGGPGLGHVARLLALAEVLRDSHGLRPHFLLQGTRGAEKFLARHGFDFTEGGVTVDTVLACRPAVCVVDWKEPCADLVAGLETAGVPVVIIDRIDCSPADLGVIPGWTWDADRPDQGPIGGPQYMLVRGDITRLRPATPPVPEIRVVVSFGGEDPFCLTEQTAAALALLPGDPPVDFVVGPGFARHRQQWPPEELARDNFNFIATRDPLESILPGAGLVITALGVTVAEAMVLGLPVAVLSNYPDDAEQVGALARLGAVADLGYHGDVNAAQLAAALDRLWSDPERRQELATTGWSLCDGQGAERAATAIAELLGRAARKDPS